MSDGSGSNRGGLGGRTWQAAAGIACCLLLTPRAAEAQLGFLDRLRDDVRSEPDGGSGGASPSSHDGPSRRHGDGGCHHGGPDCDDDGLSFNLLLFGGYMPALGVTSPWWGPHVALSDDFGVPGHFARFPYDDGPGYMHLGSLDYGRPPASAEEPGTLAPLLDNERFRRTWSGRLDVEYADEFNDVTRLGGHLLVSTASRFDIQAGMARFEERLAGGDRDRLWIGDCNLVFRFAQSERVQYRSGLGLNWLADGRSADVGFNFTYSADVFPAKPWVLTASIDWGTLGHAELFRFRATAGVLVNRFEAYAGFEYQDIDSTQFSALLAGVRLWF